MQSTLFHCVHLWGCRSTVFATVHYAVQCSSQPLSVYSSAPGQERLCHHHPSSWLIGSGCVQRYANKLGSCLLETSEDINSPANQQLAKWVSEVTSLMVCMAQGNPKVALKHGLADFTSSTHVNQADLTHRQDAFFLDLVVSSLHLRSTLSGAMSSRTDSWQCANKVTHLQAGIRSYACRSLQRIIVTTLHTPDASISR